MGKPQRMLDCGGGIPGGKKQHWCILALQRVHFLKKSWLCLDFILEFALVHGQQLAKWGIHLCIKPISLCSFFSLSIFSLFFFLFDPIHHPSWRAPALGVLLAFAFISVAQEKIVKQGQLGRERNADNILRDLKEIFTPSWELASPTEGNAVQLEQAGCLMLASFFLSWALHNAS